QLACRPLHIGIHHARVELARSGQFSLGRLEPGRNRGVVLGAPAGEPVDQLLPRRRHQHHQLALRHRRSYLAGALQLDLQHRVPAGGQRLHHRRARGAVAVAGEFRVFEQLAVVDPLRERLAVDEVVVLPVDLALPRGAGGHRDAAEDLRRQVTQDADDAGLADPGRTGDDSEPVPGLTRHRLTGALHSPLNSASRALRCRSPSPRSRRLAAISSFSMVAWARTLPTPGRASSSAETFILPRTSSLSACLSTSARVVPPRFSRSLSSARARRAAAAFSKAAARCSSVSWGSATMSSELIMVASSPRRYLPATDHHNAGSASSVSGSDVLVGSVADGVYTNTNRLV